MFEFIKNSIAKINPKWVFWTEVSILLIATLSVGVYVYNTVDGELQSLEQLENPQSDLATSVYSADGEILEQFFSQQQRNYIPYNEIPEYFIKALVSTEDRVFYDHWGVHFWRIPKAAVKNIMAGRSREGASTITQQLARNLYLDQSPTLKRKLREAATSVQIEKHYTKMEILGLYANTVYFGRGGWGLKSAAQIYFGKDPSQLTLPECAYLVGVLKGPADYGGRSNIEAGLNRRNLVLRLMYENETISESEYKLAKEAAIEFAEKTSTIRYRSIAPHFVESIRRQLREMPELDGYDIYRDGLRIHTTLNARMQRHANAAVLEHVKELQEQFDKRWKFRDGHRDSIIHSYAKRADAYIGAAGGRKATVLDSLKKNKEFVDYVMEDAKRVQVGMVAIEQATGKIRAMVGSSYFGISERYKLNRATSTRRQPGSAFKPFLYSQALINGLAPDSLVNCTYFEYLPNWAVDSADSAMHHWELEARNGKDSLITLRHALMKSDNAVAGRLVTQYVEPKQIVELAGKMGVQSKLAAVPAIALGSAEVTVLEMTAAYTTFPNKGLFFEPFSITRIEDRHGKVLFDWSGQVEANDAMPEDIAETMVGMMKGVVGPAGTGRRIKAQYFPYEAAGKTGTTNDHADAWFVGYTPELTAGVWVGFDDHRVKFTGDYGQGGRAAGPIWGMFMRDVYADSVLQMDKRALLPDLPPATVENIPRGSALPDGKKPPTRVQEPSSPETTEPSRVRNIDRSRETLRDMMEQAENPNDRYRSPLSPPTQTQDTTKPELPEIR